MWSSLSVTCDGSVVFSANQTDRHDITELLLKVALNTITPYPSTFTLTRHWGLLVHHLLQMVFLQNPNLLKKLQFYFYWLTDWLVFNANFSNISDISWRIFINCLSSKLLYIWSFCENLFKRWNIKLHRWCDGWRARLECGKSCGRCHGGSNHNLYNWHLLLLS